MVSILLILNRNYRFVSMFYMISSVDNDNTPLPEGGYLEAFKKNRNPLYNLTKLNSEQMITQWCNITEDFLHMHKNP